MISRESGSGIAEALAAVNTLAPGPFGGSRAPEQVRQLTEVLRDLMDDARIDSSRYPLRVLADSEGPFVEILLPFKACRSGRKSPYSGAFPERFAIRIRSDDIDRAEGLRARLNEAGFPRVSIEEVPSPQLEAKSVVQFSGSTTPLTARTDISGRLLLAAAGRSRYAAGVWHLCFPTNTRKGLSVSAPNPALSPETAKVKLSVVKGLRVGKNYALKEGVTYVGRKGPHAVDVDLTEQENPGVAVAVNRFALIWFDKNGLAIADTGRRVTFVNGVRIEAAKRFPLQADDTLAFGKTSLQVKATPKRRTGVQK